MTPPSALSFAKATFLAYVHHRMGCAAAQDQTRATRPHVSRTWPEQGICRASVRAVQHHQSTLQYLLLQSYSALHDIALERRLKAVYRGASPSIIASKPNLILRVEQAQRGSYLFSRAALFDWSFSRLYRPRRHAVQDPTRVLGCGACRLACCETCKPCVASWKLRRRPSGGPLGQVRAGVWHFLISKACMM